MSRGTGSGQIPDAGDTALTGTVISARTGAPLADVLVRLLPESNVEGAAQEGRTDSAGRFVIASVPPGRVTVTVSTIGYIFSGAASTCLPGTDRLTIPLAEGTGTYEESVDVAAAPPDDARRSGA